MDILGHCTGRLVTGRGRPQSTFDAERVFAACARRGVAVELNSRPERLDPPDDLLAIARDAGCRFSIDSDAHAPGQLAWQDNGAEMAARNAITPDRILTTLPPDELLAAITR
jgi:putative hydrolase